MEKKVINPELLILLDHYKKLVFDYISNLKDIEVDKVLYELETIDYNHNDILKGYFMCMSDFLSHKIELLNNTHMMRELIAKSKYTLPILSELDKNEVMNHKLLASKINVDKTELTRVFNRIKVYGVINERTIGREKFYNLSMMGRDVLKYYLSTLPKPTWVQHYTQPVNNPNSFIGVRSSVDYLRTLIDSNQEKLESKQALFTFITHTDEKVKKELQSSKK